MVTSDDLVEEDVGGRASFESRLSVLEMVKDNLVASFTSRQFGDSLADASVGDDYMADAHWDCQIGLRVSPAIEAMALKVSGLFCANR